MRALGRSTAAGAVLITTKANADAPAVLAFNKQFPKTAATPEQNAAVAAAQSLPDQNLPRRQATIYLSSQGASRPLPGDFRAKRPANAAAF
ncbi:MAG: hypothetical protein WKG07_08310 [Hymenobacter sp.]